MTLCRCMLRPSAARSSLTRSSGRCTTSLDFRSSRAPPSLSCQARSRRRRRAASWLPAAPTIILGRQGGPTEPPQTRGLAAGMFGCAALMRTVFIRERITLVHGHQAPPQAPCFAHPALRRLLRPSSSLRAPRSGAGTHASPTHVTALLCRPSPPLPTARCCTPAAAGCRQCSRTTPCSALVTPRGAPREAALSGPPSLQRRERISHGSCGGRLADRGSAPRSILINKALQFTLAGAHTFRACSTPPTSGRASLHSAAQRAGEPV